MKPARPRGVARGLLALGVLCALALPGAQNAGSSDDALLRAMRDELNRSLSLRMAGLEPPYYAEYFIHDGESLTFAATLGALLDSSRRRFRHPGSEVRVGSSKFDNTNCIFTGFAFGSTYNLGLMPFDDNYGVLRQYLWLASDLGYKSALESIARKRAALKNFNVAEQIDDFAKADPVRLKLDARREPLEEDGWPARVRELSAIFARHPEVIHSSVQVYGERETFYFANTEGAEIRVPDSTAYLEVKAGAQAADGMILRDAMVLHSRDFRRLPAEPELRRAVESVAGHLAALARAPLGESYSGPVLFEATAAAQLFAEVLGRNLALKRRPISEPGGRQAAFQESELEGRLGSRVLPEWMDVSDDPTLEAWHGRPLFGHYLVDLEGVVPKPLNLVTKGVLNGFLLTRQPVRGFAGSNGRARLPGSYGARAAAFGNLIVSPSQTVKAAELQKKLVELAARRNKPYGLLVRKMDFPSSASFEEFRRMAARMGQEGTRPVSLPLLVYRVYPDGREELTRGLRFQGLSVRSLKDIVAASDKSQVFDFLDNGALFALMGAGSFVAESSVISPSVLFDDLQLVPLEGELPKPPVVPPPPLLVAR